MGSDAQCYSVRISSRAMEAEEMIWRLKQHLYWRITVPRDCENESSWKRPDGVEGLTETNRGSRSPGPGTGFWGSRCTSTSFSALRPKIKPLGKLRHNLQVSELFHYSSVGIDANRVYPKKTASVWSAQRPECLIRRFSCAKMLPIELEIPSEFGFSPCARYGAVGGTAVDACGEDPTY